MLVPMSAHLIHLVEQAEPALATFSPGHWQASRGAGKWTLIELLGHLIDSAANNHQRFVRALAQPSLDFPGYDQTAHVSVQHYAAANPAQLITLWASLNLHIAHVITYIPADKTETPCTIGNDPAMSLANLVLDYIAHLEHHLKQLLPAHPLQLSGMPWPPANPNR
jgi:hypothetical protein